MKIVVIGSVAAGTSAAAKARRNTEEVEIVIYDRDSDISYSGCGIPYYIGNDIEELSELTPRDAKWFKKRYNIDINTNHEVLNIDKDKKKVKVRNLENGEEFSDSYDKLIVATGASPIVPPIEGVGKENVFSVRNIQNAYSLKQYIGNNNPSSAVIVGGGFIGLEVAEALVKIGIKVTLIDRLNQIMPSMDKDMTIYVENYLKKNGVELILGDSVNALEGNLRVNKVVTESGRIIETELVILAIGVKPNVSLAKEAGVRIGVTGAIEVNKRLETNVPDIYAVGDCAESYSVVNGEVIYRPLGSTANKMGRIAGDVATGGRLEFKGILGTGIFKVFDMAVAQTGLSEKEAKRLGYDIEVIHNIKPNKPTYIKGSKEMVIKGIADRKDGRLLGAQIVGYEGVDKRIDVFAAVITYKGTAEDLFILDLAYAPPFATTKDPVAYTGMALDNAINGGRPLITPQELKQKIDQVESITIIDTRAPKQYNEKHVEGAVNIPLGELREKAQTLDKESVIVTYCNKGVTGNAAQNVLINLGFKKVYNLSGGNKNYQVQFGENK